MAIQFECTSCHTPIRVKDELAGRRIRCKTCSNVVTVPQSGGEEDEFADLIAEGASQSRSMRPPERQAMPGRRKRPGGGSRGSAVSKAAYWSLGLGIASLVCCSWVTGIPAVIVGIVALVNIVNSHGALEGKGFAIAGVSTGAIGSILLMVLFYQFGLDQKIKEFAGSTESIGSLASRVANPSSSDPAARKNNLKQLGLALHNYHDSFNTFPPGGVFDKDTGHHGWQTFMLPFVEQAGLYNQIDFNIAWNTPKNATLFRTPIAAYLIPGAGGDRDAAGFGLSNYAANSQLFGKNSRLNFRNFRDGVSNTMMAGEAAGNYKPWGHPENWRDPARGIGKGPDSYGTSEGAYFLMADGSVRYFKSNASSELLRALSTPAGGEDLGRLDEEKFSGEP